LPGSTGRLRSWIANKVQRCAVSGGPGVIFPRALYIVVREERRKAADERGA
jgi:hypothetical protein